MRVPIRRSTRRVSIRCERLALKTLTLIASFLLFSPLRRDPLGSLDSDVSGLPSFRGSRTRKMENAAFPTVQTTESRKPARTQYTRTESDLHCPSEGRRLLFGSLKNGRMKANVV